MNEVLKEVKKIKVYNVTECISIAKIENEKGERMIVTEEKEIAIVVGDKGVLVFFEEGIGQKLNSIEDDYEVGLKPRMVKEGDSISYPVGSTMFIKMKVSKWMECCKCRETTVGEFIRKFGSRLEHNYQLMLDSISDIGLKRSEYEGNRHIH